MWNVVETEWNDYDMTIWICVLWYEQWKQEMYGKSMTLWNWLNEYTGCMKIKWGGVDWIHEWTEREIIWL